VTGTHKTRTEHKLYLKDSETLYYLCTLTIQHTSNPTFILSSVTSYVEHADTQKFGSFDILGYYQGCVFWYVVPVF